MGLMPNEYYRLTPVEFGLMYAGYIKKEAGRKKELRLLSWFIVKGWADPKDLPQSPEQWWPIDKEDEEIIKSSGVDIASWSEEKTKDAIDLINRMTGG